MFTITLSIHGHVREYLPHVSETQQIEVVEPLTIADLLRQQQIPSELIMSVFIDGKQVSKDHEVSSVCSILLVSPTAGG